MKRKTLLEAIKKHQAVTDYFFVRISAMLNDHLVANEDNLDFDTQSKSAESIITIINPLGDQLEFANEEMKLLYDMISHQDTFSYKDRTYSIEEIF